jgi:hypothetical protein
MESRRFVHCGHTNPDRAKRLGAFPISMVKRPNPKLISNIDRASIDKERNCEFGA